MSQHFHDEDRHILTSFAVREHVFVAETKIATVWKVMRCDDTPAALKIYRDGNMQDEAPGLDLLEAQAGRGAARIYGRVPGAVLLEWLDGPSLGDMVRAGDDDAASAALVETVNRLHSVPADAITTIPRLQDRFAALLNAQYAADCPRAAQTSLRKATALAQRLLADQIDQRPLHGDFHHDNILGSSRGYLAIDAKGVFGHRRYELANAFRNPLGSEDVVMTAEVIMRRAQIWGAGFDCLPNDLLQWAAAHAALSLAWTYEGTFGFEVAQHVDYVDRLLSLVDN